MPRLVFLLGLALAAVALAFVATDALLWRPGLTEANARRIREGMTLREVEGLLGRAPDWELMAGGWVWRSAEVTVIVHMSPEHRVVDVAGLRSAPRPGPLDSLRPLFGR